MDTVGQACLLVIAGFVLFPALSGAFFLQRNEARGAWIATTVWALSVAALSVVIVILQGASASADSAGGTSLAALASLRHLLFGTAILSALWVLQEISGNWHKRLTGIVFGLVILRAVLWFATDLVWAHQVEPSGMPVLGPLGPILNLLINGLALTIVVMITMKPWTSPNSRRACAWSLVATALLIFAMFIIRPTTTDTLVVVIFALPVVVVQATMLSSIARQYREVKRQGIRDARLAEFGRQALAPGEVVPGQAAVALVADELSNVCCVYDEQLAGKMYRVAKAGKASLVTGEAVLTVPVGSDRESVGALVVYGTIEANESGFVRSVGLVLSAALSRAAMEERLRDQALIDAVTGLPNWPLLQRRMNRLLTQGDHRMVAVMCCDVIEFKAINDEFGHDVGDALLREIGSRLGGLINATGTVARIGSDEFVIAQPVHNEAAAMRLSELVLTISQQPLTLDHATVPFEIRVGLVVTEEETADPDRLVRAAEIGLMQAKAAATRLAAYDNSEAEVEAARRKLARALAVGVANHEIFVEYQPILELATGRVVGVEALARWRTSEGELIPPLEFIPVAEANGQMRAIMESVFDQAVAQLAAWDAMSSNTAGLRLSLNVTPNEVGRDTFISWLTTLLATHDVRPSRVTMELTESALESAPEGVLANLLELKKIGIRASLDDFGTGHSSLDRLMNLPVGELKIDRRFTRTEAGPHRQIVQSVVELAHRSEMVVVAEGIETQEQWQMLLADGCEYGQGYLFSRPLSGERLAEYVTREVIGSDHFTRIPSPPGKSRTSRDAISSGLQFFSNPA